MTADDFTTAASAEAERQNPVPHAYTPDGPSQWERLLAQQAFQNGAEWARAHLIAQEPTQDEVLDLIEDRLHDGMFTASVQEPDGETTTYVDAPMAEVLRIVRAALSTARDVRGQG